jgi:ubiquinone/menaquinone biosynthesis C-methylase UbiE
VTNLNPQAKQMADESMVRNLDAQARAIWPQERSLFERYALPAKARILDAGCGTGEITSRLAELYPEARIAGVDIVDRHLELARSRYAHFGSRLTFEHGDAFGLAFDDASFDLTVCRHVLHAVPHPGKVLAELARVTRPGGYVHVLPEDYGMLHFQHRGSLDPRDFWYETVPRFAEATSTDLFVGRNAFTLMSDLGLQDIHVDYAVVDTVRTPRETFAAVIEAWRDGYVESIAEYSGLAPECVTAYFEAMIDNVGDPQGYAVWMVPILSARVAEANS